MTPLPADSPAAAASDLTLLRIGHSPDPDDAFMWYPLAIADPQGRPVKPKVNTDGFTFQHVLEDIQTLNQRCEKAELEITALSIHQYPHVADKYALTSCGSSMGDAYGPMVIARRKLSLKDLTKVRIAIPGERTTAFLALSLLLGKGNFQYESVPFDHILPGVARGQFEAGLIIHEGQLTYKSEGVKLIVDLGKWWTEKHKLPLPLGGNAIRRDLGPEKMRKVCTVLLRSIRYALEHREEAVDYALQFGRGMNRGLADKFVGMYVNQWTLDYGDTGRAAVRKLLSEGAAAGLLPACGEIDFIDPLPE